MRWGGGGKGK